MLQCIVTWPDVWRLTSSHWLDGGHDTKSYEPTGGKWISAPRQVACWHIAWFYYYLHFSFSLWCDRMTGSALVVDEKTVTTELFWIQERNISKATRRVWGWCLTDCSCYLNLSAICSCLYMSCLWLYCCRAQEWVKSKTSSLATRGGCTSKTPKSPTQTSSFYCLWSRSVRPNLIH